VRWSRGAGVVDLGAPGPDLAVRGITDDGAIVGSWQVTSPVSDFRVFVHTGRCGFQDIGVPDGEGSSFAAAINDRGRIVGQVREGDVNHTYREFVWQAERLGQAC
jgi:uncharacterized membrane protein